MPRRCRQFLRRGKRLTETEEGSSLGKAKAPSHSPDGPSRRSVAGLLTLAAGALAGWHALIYRALAEGADGGQIDALQPGQFIWHPERAPQGPVAIIASIPEQLVFVYRNGIRIGVSTCSTGKPGHRTPIGVFTVLQKAKVHTSSKYHEAMPYMERLTWKGIALHAGDLPGYPDSHGCVHLPLKFAEDLYDVTQIGTPVIIAGSHTDHVSLADPGLILGTGAKEEIEAKVGRKTFAPSGPHSVTSILVSSADKRIYVVENGDILAEGDAIIKDPSRPLGSHVFIWQGGDRKGSTWLGIGFHPIPGSAMAPDKDVLERIDGAPSVMHAIRTRMKPGTVLVTTDLPATDDTRSGKGFAVVDARTGAGSRPSPE